MSIISEKVEKHFPSHTDIGMEVEGIVHANAFFDEYQHNRETLDDLIANLSKALADLVQYRNTLPTVDEYMESGRL